MRQIIVASLLTFVLLATPAGAQQPVERILLDAELWMGGGEQRQCQMLPAGQLVVTASLTRSMLMPSVVNLSMLSMMGSMGGTTIEIPVTTEATTTRTPITAGPYCWSVTANPYSHNEGLPYVAVKMVIIAP